MGAHILLIFGARLSLHQLDILSERHLLSIQTFDRDRLDELPWLPDLEVLLSGVHPTSDPLTSQGSAHVVVLAVDGGSPLARIVRAKARL